MKITLLTPLHIGGEKEELTPLNFIHSDNKIYVINQMRLWEGLKKEGLLDSYLKEVEGKQNRFKLTAFFNGNQLLRESFLRETVSSYSLGNPHKLTPEKIKPFIANAYAQAYLPGSSLKGAIRTAIMWKILNKLKTDEPSDFKIITDFIERKLDFYEKEHPKRDRFMKTFFSYEISPPSLLELIFQRFLLEGASRRDAHTDILRAIKVSDSNPAPKDSLILKKVQVLSAQSGNGYTLTKPAYLEALPKDTQLSFSLKVDEDMLGDFQRKNQDNEGPLIPFDQIKEIIKNPLGATAEFTKELIKQEDEFFGKVNLPSFVSDLEGKGANLRLGWGGGLLATTLAMLLSKPLLQRLRNLLFRDRGSQIAPKTRRVIIENDAPHSSLGWARLEE